MKVMVAGGAGYIGSVVTLRLLEAGVDVVVLDDLSSGHADAVPEGASLVRAQLSDADATRAILRDGVEAVLHFAAKSLVAESVARPDVYWSVNVGGTRSLLDCMRLEGVSRLVFSSSAAVYGQPELTPIPEDASALPTSPYGNTKLAVDRMLADESRAYGLVAVSLRYFNVAGAVGSLGERHHPETHLIPNLLRVARSGGPCTIFGADYPTPDGTCIRDYIHVDDLARAHLLALDATAAERVGGAGGHRVYNLGNGRGFSNLEVLEAARRVTGAAIPAELAGRRAGDPAVLVAASDRIQAELGWEPQHPDLDDAVADAWRFEQERVQPERP